MKFVLYRMMIFTTISAFTSCSRDDGVDGVNNIDGINGKVGEQGPAGQDSNANMMVKTIIPDPKPFLDWKAGYSFSGRKVFKHALSSKT